MSKETIIDVATELDRRFKAAVATDRELRGYQRGIDQSQIKIQGIWDRAQLDVGLVRVTENNLRHKMNAREKWLRASIAHDLRHELKIESIPGYISPLDKLRAQNRSNKAKAKTRNASCSPSENTQHLASSTSP